MDEKTVERISCVLNRGWGCAALGEVNSLIETGAVVVEKFQQLQPVAGHTHREDVFKATKAIGVGHFGRWHVDSRTTS